MPKFTTSLVIAATAIALMPVAGPALARSSKPAVVRLPAGSLKDPAARLCMPKTVIRDAAAALPATVCQTQAEWAAAGVTIEAR